MSGNRDLAVLVGNGLSIAFSDDLLLGSISNEMIARFTAEYPGSDAVAQAMQNVAKHDLTGDPAADFEILIGAFGGQSDILDDLSVFADLIRNSDPDTVNAFQKVREFVAEVQRRGIGHTLEIIAERSYADEARRQPVDDFVAKVLSKFTKKVTIANLNYDAVLLSSLLSNKHDDVLCDMADGRWPGTVTVDGIEYDTKRLRQTEDDFMSFDQRRVRLLHLHGSITYWEFGRYQIKLPTNAIRSTIWKKYRNEETFSGRPLVVLANQNSKARHVLRQPFALAYELSESSFRDADYWLIVGYSFRDVCVNDLLRRCWEVRRDKPMILVSTMGDGLTNATIETALGWELGTGATNRLQVDRGGAFALCDSEAWKSFISS